MYIRVLLSLMALSYQTRKDIKGFYINGLQTLEQNQKHPRIFKQCYAEYYLSEVYCIFSLENNLLSAIASSVQ